MLTTNNVLLYIFLSIFIVIGFALPFVNQAFNQPVQEFNTQGIQAQLYQEDVGILDVIVSMFSIFFWTFGGVPFFVDLIIFTPMRIMFFVIIYDKIRGI